ncbi:hypothetical protein P152DRAFT_482249 [Eremomyces bilateralis CBS 781.70]|uniref:Uncharacterized protein n=1 Tax=Eremomyces bilateralis CBS 781.70 TaxID=1392243 RepID=A0A6G1G2C3_9PEZI|nr:uncharacterized protein P152DRAFT_482249 [Eremomyces bilateralis CBS 781.70]KAF1812204.1 hypothetical protein P152DRAFT_482249 [Eremomyces bilateralis CBS 781.70]
MPVELIFPLSNEDPPSRPSRSTPPPHDPYHPIFSPGALPLPKVHRGWERAPESPFVKRGPSHKIWKRYDGAQLVGGMATENADGEVRRVEGAARAVKRQKIGGAEGRSTQVEEEEEWGTPRRKRAAPQISAVQDFPGPNSPTGAVSVSVGEIASTPTRIQRDGTLEPTVVEGDANSCENIINTTATDHMEGPNPVSTGGEESCGQSGNPSVEAGETQSPSDSEYATAGAEHDPLVNERVANDAETETSTTDNEGSEHEATETMRLENDQVLHFMVPPAVDNSTELCVLGAPDTTTDENEAASLDEDTMSPTQEVTLTGPQFPNIHLDYDTEILKDFLSRAAASKASKSTNATRRESIENRRDSDKVREALSSPTKALQEKELASPTMNLELPSMPMVPNIPKENSTIELSLSTDGANDAVSNKPWTGEEDTITSSWNPRRSLRARPPVDPQTQTKKIKISLNDTHETIKLRTETRELANMTRRNTGRNKFGAQNVRYRLKSLATDSENLFEELPGESVNASEKRKQLQWHESVDEMEVIREAAAKAIDAVPSTTEEAQVDDLVVPSPARRSLRARSASQRQRTPRTKRTKGLGSTNGTPGKVPKNSMLDTAQEEASTAAEEQSGKQPTTTTTSKSNISSLPKPAPLPAVSLSVVSESTPTTRSLKPPTTNALTTKPEGALNADNGSDAASEPAVKEPTPRPVERKSRLVPPRKVKLDAIAPLVEGKENRLGVAKKLGGGAGEARKRRVRG